MSSRLKILPLFPLCLLLAGGCRFSPKLQEGHTPRSARDATVYATIVTRALATLPQHSRPSASLGVYISAYLSKGITPVHGALESTTILSLLMRTPDNPEEPFMTIQTLGDLLQTNIVDVMNRHTERGEVLNRYISFLHSTLQNAQKDKDNLEESRRQLTEKEREERNAIRAIQKDIATAEKAGDYRAVGSHQRALSETNVEHGKTKALMDELKSAINLLDDLAGLAEERLHAIEENREALMAGIRVVETPGIEKLGILEKIGKFSFRSRRKEHNRGLLDFSDL